jgi:hypothetical protein
MRKTTQINKTALNCSNNIFVAIARKSMSNKFSELNIDKSNSKEFSMKQSSLMMRRHSLNFLNQSEYGIDDNDSSDKISRIKNFLGFCFNVGLVCVIGFIQNIIYDIDGVGLSEEKTIVIPKHLIQLRNISRLSKNSSRGKNFENMALKNSLAETYILEKENEEDSENEEVTAGKKLNRENDLKNPLNFISPSNQNISHTHIKDQTQKESTNQIESFNKNIEDKYSDKSYSDSMQVISPITARLDMPKEKFIEKQNSININFSNILPLSPKYVSNSLYQKLKNLILSLIDENV